MSQIHEDIPSWAHPLVDDVREIRKFITGGSEPEKGLPVRLDRLEQAESRRNFWTNTAVGAAITAAVGAAWSIFTGHK